MAPSSTALGVDIGPMTWTQRSDWINVQTDSRVSPHAVGNGIVDDTAAIQSALTYLTTHAYGLSIYFPAGTYKISSTLTLSGVGRTSLIGCGSNTTIIWAGATGAAMFWPSHVDGMRYIGLVWDGNNLAGCAFEQWSSDGNYDTQLRHENESFRNFTQQGTYLANHAPVPGAAIAGGFTSNGVFSLEADSMLINCRFSNCSVGFLNSYELFNNFEWIIDRCEFDNCGAGIQVNSGGCYMINNCHFQNSTTADILGGFGIRAHHCTSQGSACFSLDAGSPDVFQDCWVDGWTNTTGAIIEALLVGQDMIFDCNFTNPPVGAKGVFDITNNAGPHNLLLSNNYAQGFQNGYGIVNPANQQSYYKAVPPGLRLSTLTSPSQTFLNSAAIADSTHVIDVTQAPYNASPGGVTDDTTIIQSAITAAQTANNGTIVYFPHGLYKISSTLTATGSNFSLQGCHDGQQFDWYGPNGGTMLAISNPKKVLIESLCFCTMSSTVTGIEETATGTSSISYDEVSYSGFDTGNPEARNGDMSDGPGLVLSNLPSGATVYLNHLLAPLTVTNCGPAQIFSRWLQNNAINISGTAAKTGFLGVLAGEGGQTENPSAYNITVNDDQDFVYCDYYTEQSYNDLQLLQGAGTGTGRVTIEGLNVSSKPGSIAVNVSNYAGRLFVGPHAIGNEAGTAVPLQFSGTNALDAIFDDVSFNGAIPAITLGAGTNLIGNMDIVNTGSSIIYLADTPSPLAPKNDLSIALAFDHIRQLEAVDMSSQLSLATDDPPLAAYEFEGDATDTTTTYNGTASNVAYGDGEVGAQAAVFNGTNSYVQTTRQVAGTFSISMWLQTTDTGSTGKWYAGKGLIDAYKSVNGADFGTALNGGKFSFGVGDPDTTLTSSTTVNDGKWHFLVATRNTTTGAMQIYVDGVLNNSATGPTGTRSASSKVRIGSIQTGVTGGFLNGRIDQAQVYNYALSAADVTQLYNHSGSFAPLAAYWKLDETSGGTSADATGHGINGTWMNSPAFTTDHPSLINFPDAGSLSFNGTNQYVTAGTPPGLPHGYAPRTISGWAKNNGTSGSAVFLSYGTPSTSLGMWIGANGTSLSAGSWGDDLTDIPSFWDNNWHFICLTYDGATAKLYADGVLKESAAKSWALFPNVCYIGCYLNNSAFWNGNVDDCRIYNRALTAPEITRMAAGNL